MSVFNDKGNVKRKDLFILVKIESKDKIASN